MPPPFIIPASLASTNLELNGAEGVEWLARLPTILASCERRWSLTIGPPFPQLSYNYAALARRRDGTTLVVKICFPDKELRLEKTEAEALRLYAGRGAVQLLDADLDQGVLLLEHVSPGTMLSEVKDDTEATSIAASVMKQLWRPVPEEHSFPSVADWAQGMVRLRACFSGGTGPFPARLVEEAERLFADLLGSMSAPVVLHGDLHHFNILAAERQPWLAIDPQGIVGEPCYETGALLRNPMPAIYAMPHLDRLLARRIAQLAEELAFDRERIRGWAVAQAVLSAWWFFEDDGAGTHESWKAAIAFAEVLSGVR